MMLPHPEPPLTDGTVLLRRWEQDDLGCVGRADALIYSLLPDDLR